MRSNPLKLSLLLLGSILWLAGCNKKQDIFTSQMTMILNWVESRTSNGAEYAEVSSGVFRSFSVPESGKNSPVAEKGDSVFMMFGIYRFTSGFSGSRSELIFTNKAELMPDRVTWSRDTLKVKLGAGGILKGVEESLVGSAPGDVVTVVMTSSNAYGDHTVQQLAPNTPIAWLINVERVIDTAN